MSVKVGAWIKLGIQERFHPRGLTNQSGPSLSPARSPPRAGECTTAGSSNSKWESKEGEGKRGEGTGGNGRGGGEPRAREEEEEEGRS